jgi:hypothetical protein
VSDGVWIDAAWYASGAEAKPVFLSASVRDVRLYAGTARLQQVPDVARVVVPEPLVDQPGCGEILPARRSSCTSTTPRSGSARRRPEQRACLVRP